MKNAKTNTNAIVFAQAQDSTKAVVANKYVAHTLYAQNKALVEALGGEVIKGVDGFRAEFKTVKNAKAFIAQAITSVSKSEYNKARKTEPKKVEPKKATVPAPAKGAKKATKKAEENTMLIGGKLYAMTESEDGFVLTPIEAPKKAKGKSKTEDKGFRFERVTDKKGNTKLIDTRADEPTKKTTAKKAKGNAKPTTAPNAKAKEAEPKKSKGNCKVDFSKLAGKGRAANKDAAALMRKAGLVDGTSAEYKAVWAEWCKVR
jgi:hypothetical protein